MAKKRKSKKPTAQRILVVHVDDEDAARCCDALRRCGFDPALTTDGEDALRMVAEEHFDAVLVDLDIPRVDALDVVGGLRMHPPTSALPIVALARVLSDDVRELVTGRGCDRVVARPVDAVAVAHEIEGLLGLTPAAA